MKVQEDHPRIFPGDHWVLDGVMVRACLPRIYNNVMTTVSSRYMGTHIFVYIYTQIYICMCVYLHIHIHTYTDEPNLGVVVSDWECIGFLLDLPEPQCLDD